MAVYDLNQVELNQLMQPNIDPSVRNAVLQFLFDGDTSNFTLGDSGPGNSGGNSSRGSTTGTGSAVDADDTDNSAVEVRHRDGMSELIRNGRYIMRDARGRTIVNRRATSADATRLESFTH